MWPKIDQRNSNRQDKIDSIVSLIIHRPGVTIVDIAAEMPEVKSLDYLLRIAIKQGSIIRIKKTRRKNGNLYAYYASYSAKSALPVVA